VSRKDRRFLCKVFLFFKTKIQLEGRTCKYIAEMHVELQAVLDSTMMQEFQRCF